MPSETVEDYLKTLFVEQQRLARAAGISQQPVSEETLPLLPMGQLATSMAVSAGTVTSMVKTLAKSGLVRYEPRAGCSLTSRGLALALHVLRRHRLVELFLVQVMGFDWTEVHDDAERLEHAISEKMLSRMDEMLGYPAFDPHGDPIPTKSGEMPEQIVLNLAEAKAKENYILARVMDQDVAFLDFLEKNNLRPGVSIYLSNRSIYSESLTVKLGDGEDVTLGLNAARKMMVTATTNATA